MEIRRSKPDDAPGIAAIEAECFADPWSVKDIFSYVCDSLGMCYTALEDGVPIAYLIGRCIPPEGEIYRIATTESKRGRGIAYRLMSYALKTERGRGLECVFLEVRSRNLPAISLYRSFGFTQIGRRAGYYKNPDDDALIMLYK